VLDGDRYPEQMLGHSADAVEGTLLSALVHAEDAVALAQLALTRALAGWCSMRAM
jgi:hypothetical protein